MTLQMLEGQSDPDAVLAALNGEVIEAALMFDMDFAEEPVRISTRIIPFEDNQFGHAWMSGAGLLIALPDYGVSDQSLAPLREYSLGIPKDILESSLEWRLAMAKFAGDRANYFGRAFTVYFQLFAVGRPVGNPIVIDTGEMDRIVPRFSNGVSLVTLSVESLTSRQGVNGYGSLTYNDQLSRFVGDLGCAFTTEFYKQVQRTNW